MVARTGWRRLAGIFGVLTVFLTAGLGVYGASNGYLIDSSTAAPVLPSALTLLLVLGFVGLISAVGSKNGGWVHTPYW